MPNPLSEVTESLRPVASPATALEGHLCPLPSEVTSPEAGSEVPSPITLWVSLSPSQSRASASHLSQPVRLYYRVKLAHIHMKGDSSFIG